MGAILRVERDFYLSFLRPRLKLHYDATAKTPLKIYYVLVLRLGLCGLPWRINYGPLRLALRMQITTLYGKFTTLR